MEPLLHTDRLAVGYGSHALLKDVALDLNAGELTALIGVNGIGKSTLLRTLAGLMEPVSGLVEVNGHDMRDLTSAERARQVSIVLTGRPPAGMLDVETLVSLGRQPWTGRWGGLSAKDHEQVALALRRTGAEHLRGKSLATCSDGECQKILIARALAQATPILLLDEPTAFLDLPNRANIVRTLRAIAHEEQKALLFSTHDLQLALDLCDRLVLIRRNAPIWLGSPQEALDTGELTRAFSGSGIHFDPSAGTHRFVS